MLPNHSPSESTNLNPTSRGIVIEDRYFDYESEETPDGAWDLEEFERAAYNYRYEPDFILKILI